MLVACLEGHRRFGEIASGQLPQAVRDIAEGVPVHLNVLLTQVTAACGEQVYGIVLSAQSLDAQNRHSEVVRIEDKKQAEGLYRELVALVCRAIPVARTEILVGHRWVPVGPNTIPELTPRYLTSVHPTVRSEPGA